MPPPPKKKNLADFPKVTVLSGSSYDSRGGGGRAGSGELAPVLRSRRCRVTVLPQEVESRGQSSRSALLSRRVYPRRRHLGTVTKRRSNTRGPTPRTWPANSRPLTPKKLRSGRGPLPGSERRRSHRCARPIDVARSCHAQPRPLTTTQFQDVAKSEGSFLSRFLSGEGGRRGPRRYWQWFQAGAKSHEANCKLAPSHYIGKLSRDRDSWTRSS